jgi:hypothetical protein
MRSIERIFTARDVCAIVAYIVCKAKLARKHDAKMAQNPGELCFERVSRSVNLFQLSVSKTTVLPRPRKFETSVQGDPADLSKLVTPMKGFSLRAPVQPIFLAFRLSCFDGTKRDP